MTILSSETIQSAIQADNTIKIRHIHTDHIGKTYESGLKRVDLVFDIAADRAASAIDADTNTIEIELQGAIQSAEQGLPVDRVPVYQSQPDFDRRLLGRFMLIADVHVFHNSLQFFLNIESRGGANASQRASYLGISTTDYGLIADRYGDSQGAAFFITDSKNQVWDELPQDFE